MLNHKDESMGAKKSIVPPDHIGGILGVETKKLLQRCFWYFLVGYVCVCMGWEDSLGRMGFSRFYYNKLNYFRLLAVYIY